MNVRALPGLGVEGRVQDAAIVCGTPRLFTERGAMTPAIATLAQTIVTDGHVAGSRGPQRHCRSACSA